MDVLLLLAAIAIGLIICEGIEYLLNLWGDKQELPENAKAELSETDEEMVDKTKQVISDTFSDSVLKTISSSSNKKRIDLMTDFANNLAREYGLDIEIDVTVSEMSNCGYYNWNDKKAVFNISMMMVDKNNQYFEYCVKETLDTIIHELRHAVQHKAIIEEGFWNVDEERRCRWADNIANYISPSVDRKGYERQPIELDARTFAYAAMEGVC